MTWLNFLCMIFIGVLGGVGAVVIVSAVYSFFREKAEQNDLVNRGIDAEMESLRFGIQTGEYIRSAEDILNRMADQKARKLMDPTIPDVPRWGLKKDGTPKAKPGRKVGYKAKKPEPVTNPPEVANPVET